MNLDELQSVQSRERQTDSLQQLRASFYEDAAEFVQDLRKQRAQAAERAEDPFDSPEVNRLSDDIRTAEQTVEAIYERRVGKVVKMASLAAADMPTEQEGLTKEEQELFETMVGAIEDHRDRILDVLGGETPAGAVASPPPGEDRAAAEAAAATAAGDDADGEGLDAAAVMGDGDDRGGSDDGDASPDQRTAEGTGAADTDSGPTPDPGEFDAGAEGEGHPQAPPATDAEEGTDEGPGGSAPSSGAADGDAGTSTDADEDRVTVRITEDVGEIFGVDEREYDLATDDVVTLPATNAEPLIDRDAAEPLE